MEVSVADWLALIGKQPLWVVALLGLAGILAFVAKNFSSILSIFKMSKTRALSAKVEMTANIRWLGQHDGQHVAAIEVSVLNKGAVRLYIDNLHFSLRAISESSPLGHSQANASTDFVQELDFPDVIIEDGVLFPPQWNYAWVDPGCDDVYRHACTIPKSAKFVMLRVKLSYPDELDDFQIEQHFATVPAWEDQKIQGHTVKAIAG